MSDLLATPLGHGALELPGLFSAAFRALDREGAGTLCAGDVRAALAVMCPRWEAEEHAGQHACLDRPGQERVSHAQEARARMRQRLKESLHCKNSNRFFSRLPGSLGV